MNNREQVVNKQVISCETFVLVYCFFTYLCCLLVFHSERA